MLLKNMEEVKALEAAVSRCEGEVWLEAPDGTRYNLKSEFSKIIGLGELMHGNDRGLEIFTQLPKDNTYLMDYLYAVEEDRRERGDL